MKRSHNEQDHDRECYSMMIVLDLRTLVVFKLLTSSWLKFAIALLFASVKKVEFISKACFFQVQMILSSLSESPEQSDKTSKPCRHTCRLFSQRSVKMITLKCPWSSVKFSSKTLVYRNPSKPSWSRVFALLNTCSLKDRIKVQKKIHQFFMEPYSSRSRLLLLSLPSMSSSEWSSLTPEALH